MITRRSARANRANRAAKKAVPAIRTLRDYLDEQEQLLDQAQKILTREYQAIKDRKLDQLEGIAEEKSSCMLKLQSNDQRLKLHPDAALLKTEYAPRVATIKSKLGQCKMQNETNGKLIQMMIAANRRLTSVLMTARDKMSANMTYTDKGTTVATGPLRVNTNV